MEKLLSKDWKEKMERLNTSELLAEVKGRTAIKARRSITQTALEAVLTSPSFLSQIYYLQVQLPRALE